MPGSSESGSIRSKGFVTKADGLNRNTISTLTQTVSTLTVNSVTLRASILSRVIHGVIGFFGVWRKRCERIIQSKNPGLVGFFVRLI